MADGIKNNKYLLLGFFAILPEYPGKGYGTKVFELLKKIYKEYDGIYIEVEKIGL